jgi:hypothetical protein
LLRGHRNGLRWETKGHKEIDADGNVVHVHHNIIHHPHSTHIAKVLFRAVASKSKMAVGAWLAAIYDFAADNMHLCGVMEPEAFFAYAKNSWRWSREFKDDAFWAFTYKLFHARALYLDTIDSIHFEPNPLTDALDRFRDEFYERYDPDVVFAPRFGKPMTQEEIEDVEDDRSLVRQTRETYFKYSWADSEGDGSDKVVATIVHDENIDPIMAKYDAISTLQDPPSGDMARFYYDLGPRTARYGHKDAYQEIEEALAQAEEEELAKAPETTDFGNIEDMLMDVDMVGTNEDDEMGDVGLGNLGI